EASLSLAWTLARRELRSGLQGFRIFLICLIVGVTAIAAVGALSSAVERGLANEGRPLLGGDLEFSVIHRTLSIKERLFLETRGEVSLVATMRAMAQAGGERSLVELKAVDVSYPLYGALALDRQAPLAEALAMRNGRYGAVAEPLLLERLGLKDGDVVRVGDAEFEIRAAILREPDRVADGFILGPRLMTSHDALEATGLLKPGSLVTYRYRLALAGDPTPETVRALREEANAAFPDAGWNIRARDRAAPGVERFIDRLSLFLALVGLTALIVGGVGVANSVSTFLDRKRENIAILKCLGASRALVFRVYFLLVLAVASIGIAVALVLGAATPWIAHALIGPLLPVPIATGFDPMPLLHALAFGYLVTIAFALWPLAEARAIAPAALFRNSRSIVEAVPEKRFVLAIVIFLEFLAALALLVFPDRLLTLWYIGGVVGSFAVLALFAFALMRFAERWVRPKGAVLKYAVANLYRPGAATPSVILSLGLGLTLFVTLALIDRNLTLELRQALPERAPSFFFLDVQSSEADRFKTFLGAQPGVTAIEGAPMLRGRVRKLGDVPVEQARPDPEVAWAVRGDRGLTYSDTLPKGSRLVAGEWWPANYSGPPLVSFVDEIANGLGLKLGDKVTVNVLGRDVEATVANFRRVDWRSLQINFAMVFSPNTLKGAPHIELVTASVPPGSEAGVLKAVTAAFPTVTAVSVKDALLAVNDLADKLLLAIRGANAITLIVGAIVLAGALATSLSTRLYDAAVLKTFGATRRQLVGAFTLEYALLGLLTAAFATVAGSAASWAIITFVMETDWRFSPVTALLTALTGMGLTVAAGLFTTWRALDAKPARILRTE
ncbi:MAG: ABC transporter permease, partial [Methyloceanibacter sp.]